MNIQFVAPLVAPYADELVAFRRDVHAHPEIARTEVRTTRRVAERLERAGLRPVLLPGAGLVCDIGRDGPVVALRGDLDALPLTEATGLAYASQVPGACHACGHDVHTTAVLGAGLVLAGLAAEGRLPGRVRLIFQPAEEAMPGGALDVLASGALDGVDRAYALPCDPHTDVGQIGSRVGAITAAADHVRVKLAGRGGHTSRPHLTEDVVFALGQVIVGAPAVLSRRIDPRAGAALVWGAVSAGSAANAIPAQGEVAGTFRCLDNDVWSAAGAIVTEAIRTITEPYGVQAEVSYLRGVPPTVNDAEAVEVIEGAVRAELGATAVELTPQSLGGEDFAWILEKVPGAMVRLGTRTPGGRSYDLHRPDLVVDERAIGIGARVLAATALRDLTLRAQASAASPREVGADLDPGAGPDMGPSVVPHVGPNVATAPAPRVLAQRC